MAKYFYLLVATILISCAVSPAIAATSSALPPGYPQTKETIVTMTDLPPGATVHVDNIKVGTVSTIHPSQSLQFRTTPGTHKLQIQALGYQPWTGSFSINSGEQKTIIVQLSPEPRKTATPTPVWTPRPQPTVLSLGVMTLSVTPSHATVTIDGIPSKKGVPLSLYSGTHTIVVKAIGYITKTEQIQINLGDHLNPNIALEKDPKTIAPEDLVLFEATSDPTGASVYIDGRLNGTTPCTIATSLGQHTVTFRMEGHQDREETIDFYKNAAGRTSPQRVFWMLTEGGTSSAPVQKETVVRETPRSTPSTAITRAGAQAEEPKDVLQCVIYFFRGLFRGSNERDER